MTDIDFIKDNEPNFQQKSKMILSLILVSLPLLVFAYIDPGSGSAIVAAVLGIIAAIRYTIRKSFYKIKRKIVDKKKKKRTQKK